MAKQKTLFQVTKKPPIKEAQKELPKRFKPTSAIIELMNRRERQILVHSYLYYELNANIVTDHEFDMWSQELADMIKQYPEDFRQTEHYSAFILFDGSTGMDLPYKLPWIIAVAERLQHYRPGDADA